MATDTSEQGLESLMVSGLCAHGWIQGSSIDFDSAWAIDLNISRDSLPTRSLNLSKVLISMAIRCLAPRLYHASREKSLLVGIIDVLRKGIKHGPV